MIIFSLGSFRATRIITDKVAKTMACLMFLWGFSMAETGLDFPGSAAVPNGSTVRFKFTDPHTNGLPIYGPEGRGLTYIWRAYPKSQLGYYTAFFWANDDGVGKLSTFTWHNGGADTFYGAHPYPRGKGNTNPGPHDWEISVKAIDKVNGVVEFGRWHTQALRVWKSPDGKKHHEYYWDLPHTDSAHRVIYTAPAWYGELNPPVPALTWGDAPWVPGGEVWFGVLRGFQIYNNLLTLEDIQNEIKSPLSTPNGSASIWYMNLNPTPKDISDKSGRENNPAWVGPLRPKLWRDSDTSIQDKTAPIVSSVTATEDFKKVSVVFNESVTKTSCEQIVNYVIDKVSIISITQRKGKKECVLNLGTGLLENVKYVLSINNIKDLTGNSMEAPTRIGFFYIPN